MSPQCVNVNIITNVIAAVKKEASSKVSFDNFILLVMTFKFDYYLSLIAFTKMYLLKWKTITLVMK